MVIATVKGDVHDIGKNICNVIMNCNGFDMIDMGVMVPGEEIVERAIAENADFIGLSGLITPSLEEMCNVAKLMEIKGLKIPLLIGGATTSAIHTAVKIAPCYGGPVVYTRDAASMPAVAQRLVNPATHDAIVAEVRASQERLREKHSATVKLLSLDEAKSRRPELKYPCYVPVSAGVHDMTFDVDTLRDYINWRAFLSAWGLDASFASLMDVKGCDHCKAQWLASVPTDKVNKAAEAMQLLKEAQFALNAMARLGGVHARVALLPAGSDGDTIIYKSGDEIYRLATLRQQHPSAKNGACVALSDYLCPIGDNGELCDWIGLFAVTSGREIESKIAQYKAQGDDYKMILYQTLADRLVEAATEVMHKNVRRELWGYAENEPENEGNRLLQYYKGIRPAIGYPSLPDQSLIFVLDKVLKYAEIGVTVTEHGAMAPAASTTGVIISHPDSSYFMVGPIDETQRKDYAKRRGMTLDELKKYLP
jgi:5-methyltetrahydrofolate--homocysteine methyltransferase